MSNETTVAAPPAQQPPTNAIAKAKPAAAMDLAKEMVLKPQFLSQIRLACPKSLNPDRVARAVLTAALGSQKLQECFTTAHGKATVAQAILKATQRGLEIDGRQGHLVPFFSSKKKAMEAVFVPGYQGLIDLAYRHPSVGSIWVEVVYDTDDFHYELGLDRTIKHIRNDNVDPGTIVAVYAVCKMRNSDDKTFVVLRQRDINRIRAYSRGASDPDSLWNKDPESMWKKSAIRQLVKYIPQSAELQLTLSDEYEDTKTEKSASISADSAATSVLSSAAAEQSSEPAPANDATKDDNIPFDSLPSSSSQSAPPPQPPRTRRTRTTMVEEPITVQPATWQQQLATIVTGMGVSFDAFVMKCIDAGQLPDSTTATNFDEIPTDVAQRLVTNRGAFEFILN